MRVEFHLELEKLLFLDTCWGTFRLHHRSVQRIDAVGAGEGALCGLSSGHDM